MEPRATVAGIVRDVFGADPASVVHVPTLEDSDVFRIELASTAVYFKAEHEGHPIDVLAWWYRKVAEVGVPVPDVLHVDVTKQRWPRDFILIGAVAGSDLEHDPLQGPDLVRAIEGYGELLRRIHSIEMEGFGELTLEGGGAEPMGEHHDHACHVRSSTRWAMPYLVERGLLSPGTPDRVAEVLERHTEILEGPERGVLLHDDAGLDHLFIDRPTMEIVGLIDPEPRSGDPAWDLASFSFHYPHLARHLIGGYGAVPDDLEVRLQLYGLIRAVGCARWDHERSFDVNGTIEEIDRRVSKLTAMLG